MTCLRYMKKIIIKTKTFIIDHWHLLIKSPAENHLRILELKVKPVEGENCNLSFESYSDLRKYQKKVRIFTFSLSSTAISVFLAIIAIQILFPAQGIKGATYGWLQNSWAGGATANKPNHTNNQSGWTEYASKDANISAGAGGVTLNSTTPVWNKASDANMFTNGTKANTYVTGGNIALLRPIGATGCTVDADCDDGLGKGQGWCNAGTCANPWLSGPCDAPAYNNIKVLRRNLSTTYVWKTSASACEPPQCGQIGAQDGDNLVNPITNPGVDFSLYPAQNACKAIGGRLPTLAEGQCLFDNKATYSIAVGAWGWTSTEYTTAAARAVRWADWVGQDMSKTIALDVRCVR